MLEKDEEKKSQLESDMEELTDYRSRAVDKIEDNTLIIEEGPIAAETETVNRNRRRTDVTSNSSQIRGLPREDR